MTITHVCKWTLALALVVIGAGAALAAVTFDPATGKGFVGKGDVQLVYGWNNKELQTCAPLAGENCVDFRAVTVTERTWVCTNANNENIQERERTTTTQQIVDDTSRDSKKQVTGFILEGYIGDPIVVGTEGPPLNSCPGGPWTLTSPAGDPVPVPEESGVEVSIDGINWFALQ